MRMIFSIFIVMVTAIAVTAEEHRFVWIDTETHTRVEEAVVTANDVGASGNWWIKKSVLRGGKQEGVDVITVNNGKAVFTIVPTRGMSIWEVRSGNVRLGWDSPVSEIVHPKFVRLEDRGGLGWLEGFGGWFVRCGLEFAGHPGLDRQVNNTGAVVETPLTLHGKIDYLPASRVEMIVDDRFPTKITVRGMVKEYMMFGPNLTLHTDFVTHADDITFHVRDKVVNDSGHDSEMMMIYHPNFGTPLLGEGSKLMATVERVTPRDDRAAEYDPENVFVYAAPTAGYVEQVYYMKPKSSSDGNAWVLLHNANEDKGVAMAFDSEQFPCLSLWKNTTSLKDGYVTGIEPGTSYPNNRSIERKNGNVPVLKPGESREFNLKFQILDGAQPVKTVKSSMQAIIDKIETQYDKAPVAGISN